MPPASPAAPRPSKDLLLGLLLLTAAVAGGAVLARRAPEAPPRPAPSDALLEGRFPFVDGAFSQRIRVNAPAMLELRFDVPPGETLRGSFGPPGPVEAAPVDAPDPARAVRFEVKAGDPPRVEPALAYGLYVLRVELVPRSDTALRAASPSAGVRVRAMPDR